MSHARAADAGPGLGATRLDHPGPNPRDQPPWPWPWSWDMVQPFDYGNNASGWDSAAELRHKARYKVLFTDGQVNHGYDPAKDWRWDDEVGSLCAV